MSNEYLPVNTYCEVQSGFAFPSSSFVEAGVPIVRMSDLKSGQLRFYNAKYVSEHWCNTVSEFALRDGDFLLGMSGSLTNHATVTSNDLPALLNQRVGRLRQKNKKVNYRYISYWLKSEQYARYADIQGEGAAQKNISSKQIGCFIYRNALIGEQNKIVEILSYIDQTIEKTEALIEKYQQVKAGLMHDLFTRGITADGKLRPSREQAPELYQETVIGWIPKDWEVCSISELAHPSKGSTVIGPFGSDLVMSDYRTEGTPIIFVRDVKEDRFTWKSNVFISERKTQALFAHRVKSGDILATKMGLPPCVAAVYPEDMPLGIITADMIRMTSDPSKVNAKWLSSALNHDRSKRQVAAITAGVTRQKVTLADFRSLKVAVPNIEEQERKTKSIDSSQMLIAHELQNLEKLLKQKSGLMQDLLTGKVPVPLDKETLHV